MPQIDLPLEELYAYQGRNPRPDDFDAYWNRALEEMRRVDPQITMELAWFQSPIAECFDLWFTGVGGSRLHAKYLRPKHVEGPHPAAVLFHGYSWHSGEWSDKLGLVAEGFSVLALDVRGQGGPSEELGGYRGTTFYGHIIRGVDDPDPDKLLYRQIYLDTAQAAGILMDMPEVDPDRVIASGWSQGGALTLACAALEPRIKMAFPVYPFLCDWKRVWEMDLAKSAYQALRDYFRMFDPRHEREDWFWNKMGYIDIQHLAPRIRAEVVMATGLMDDICPPSTQFAAFNKIQSKKEVVIYPDYTHEGLPGFNDRMLETIRGL